MIDLKGPSRRKNRSTDFPGLAAETHLRMSEVLVQEAAIRQLGVLAGPNIAGEIALGKPAGTVVATRSPRIATLVMRALSCARLRVFESGDVCGVELCGALKNVVAIAGGMIDELALGESAKAILVTRDLSELMRLALALGAEPATTAGLAGIGVSRVTCASPPSRNHRVSVALARGERLPDVFEKLGMVAEAVHASRSVCKPPPARTASSCLCSSTSIACCITPCRSRTHSPR